MTAPDAFVSRLLRMSQTGLTQDRCRAGAEHSWLLVHRRPLATTGGAVWVLRFECQVCGSRGWGGYQVDMLWQLGVEIPIAAEGPEAAE